EAAHNLFSGVPEGRPLETGTSREERAFRAGPLRGQKRDRGGSTHAGSTDPSANGTCPVPVEVYTSPMRSTKIVATIGPASREPAVLEQMIAVGMDVARLNFAHGDPEEHAETIERIRAAAER